MNDDRKFIAGLAAAVGLGVLPRPIIAAVTEAFTPDRLTLEERRYLEGPFVIHQNQWTDTLPKWMLDQAASERVGIVFGITPDYIVGPTEIAAAMYPATMASPLYHDHSELYLWATVNAAAKKHGTDVTAMFTKIGMKPIEDSDVLERDGRLFNTYQQLAREIRRRVVNAQAARDGADRREAKAAPPEPVLPVDDEPPPRQRSGSPFKTAWARPKGSK